MRRPLLIGYLRYSALPLQPTVIKIHTKATLLARDGH